MKRVLAILGSGIVAGTVAADDVNWHAAVPLWKSLSVTGRVVEAGPAPAWLGPKPPEPQAKLGLPARPAPEGLPRPRELPEPVIAIKDPPVVHASSPAVTQQVGQPRTYGRESFASDRKVQQLKPATTR